MEPSVPQDNQSSGWSRRLNRLNVVMGLALFVIVALTATVFWVRANSVANRKDQMSNQIKSTAAAHQINFTLAPGNSFAAGEQIAVDFPPAFTLSGTWTAADFAFTDGTVRPVVAVNAGAGASTVSCADGTDDIGVAIDTAALVFRAIPCGASFVPSAVGASVTFTIDGETPNGTLTNPATAGSYQLIILDAAGDCTNPLTDNCGLAVAVVDSQQINISAFVSSTCGNSIVEPGESCDDGNAVGGDGCSATCQTEGGGGGAPPPPPDTTPPVISAVSCTNITKTGMTINWTTNEASDSLVRYGLTSSYGDTSTDFGLVFNHTRALIGLSEGTLYHYQACSRDSSNNQGCSTDYTCATVDETPPTITNVQVTDITSTGAKVTWTTNENSTSFVDYGLPAGPPYASTSGQADSVVSHSVTLSGLTPGTTYHYRVRSADAAANERITVDASFATLAPPDTTPPVISAVTVTDITSTGAKVTWTTNENSTSFVDYGTAAPPPYASTSGQADSVVSHSVTLSGLAENTTYNYSVRSADAAANSSSSANATFKTLDVTPPVISAVTATNITATGARITWTTNEASDSRVNYGPTVAYGSTQADAAAVTAHQIDLTGLTPNTTYHYLVKSKDASNNEATSADFTFTTPKPAAPVISNVQATMITQTGARITWTTTTSSDSKADYGLTTAYGTTLTNATMVTSHLIVLTGLTKGTTYHFQVRSTDAYAQEAVSGDNTFATLPDTTPPANVTGFTATAGDSQVTLGWTNPTDADFQGVKIMRKTSGFPTGPADGTQVYSGTGVSLVDPATNGVTYYYAAFAFDDVPNYSSGAVASATPAGPPDTTPPANVTGFTAVPGDAQITLTWTNPTDADFQGVKIMRRSLTCPTSATDGTLVYDGTGTSKLDAGLSNGTLYCYKAFTYDAVPNVSSGVEASSTPVAPADTTPPGPVSGFTASAGDAQVQLIWSNPSDADWAGTRILRKTDGYPTGPTDGSIVYDGVGDNALVFSLSNGTTYYFSAFAYDANANFAVPANVEATPTSGALPPTPPACTDTDGGKNVEVKGTVTDLSGSFDDACGGPLSVKEYFCEGGASKSEVLDCAAGYKCSGGRCVVEAFQPTLTVCGNGICEGAENSLNCPVDCPVAATAPPVEPESPAVVEEQHLSLRDFQFYATASRIRLRLNDQDQVQVFPTMTVRIYLPDAVIPKPIKSAFVNYQNAAYMMRPTASYETQVTTSSALGLQSFNIVVNYEDGTSDSVSGQFNIVPFGQVYESKDGADVGVTGARVTLLKDFGGGNFGVWSGGASGQSNPQVAGEGGRYGFIVEPGTYKLVAEKEGYRTKETLAFPVGNENVITTRLLLIVLPPPPVEKIQDIIKTEAPVVTKTVEVAKVVTEQAVYAAEATVEDVKEFAENEYVEQTTERVATPVATAVAVANVASYGAATATGIPYFMYLYSLLSHPLMLIARRRRKKWGVVFNALTRMPVDLAIVRLIDADTNRVLRTAVTDKDGRYIFIAQAGSYKLTVAKAGFVFPTTFMKDQKVGVVYADLYHGESLKIKEETTLTMNIPVDPVSVEKTPRQIVAAGIARRMQASLGILAIVLMAGAAVVKPSVFVIGMLLTNIVAYIVFRRLSVTHKPRSWGVVYDEKTKKPLRNALARIFEARFNKLLETQITDSRGHYTFLVGRNVYYVTFEKPGYQKQQKGPVDLADEKKAKEGVIGLDVALAPAGKDVGPTKPAPPPAPAPAAPATPPAAPPPAPAPAAPATPPAAPPPAPAPATPPAAPPPAPAPAAPPQKKIPWELQLLQKTAAKKAEAPAAPAPAAPATPPAAPPPAPAPAAPPQKKIPWELQLLQKTAAKKAEAPAAPPPAPAPAAPPQKKIPWELQLLQKTAANKAEAPPAPPAPAKPDEPKKAAAWGGLVQPKTPLIQDFEHAHPGEQKPEEPVIKVMPPAPPAAPAPAAPPAAPTPAAPPAAPTPAAPPQKKIPWELQLLQKTAAKKAEAPAAPEPAKPAPVTPPTAPNPPAGMIQDVTAAHPETKLIMEMGEAHPEETLPPADNDQTDEGTVPDTGGS